MMAKAVLAEAHEVMVEVCAFMVVVQQHASADIMQEATRVTRMTLTLSTTF
jgi:hypothetical protein